jgi:hypothetical protein
MFMHPETVPTCSPPISIELVQEMGPLEVIPAGVIGDRVSGAIGRHVGQPDRRCPDRRTWASVT